MSGHATTDTSSTVASRNDEHLPIEEVLAPDEPPTPVWMPLLGLAGLLLGVLFGVAMCSDDDTAVTSGVEAREAVGHEAAANAPTAIGSAPGERIRMRAPPPTDARRQPAR